MKAQLSFFHDNGKFEATHEIEIPDGATLFQYQTNEGHLYHFYREEGICSYGHFPIPRPKKKVKKWWWDFEDDNAADGFLTVGPYTEEEVKADYPNAKWYHRIDETMIEVEE